MTSFMACILFAEKELCHASSLQKFQIFPFARINGVFLSLEKVFSQNLDLRKSTRH